MGSSFKPRPTEFYETLIHLYPLSFREHYGAPMVQTFDDMLKAESTRTGRCQIYATTLLNLPFSAVKEHLTNGQEIIMNRNFKLFMVAALMAILIVGAGSFWAGTLRARQNIGIEHVGVAQLADAMEQDHFYIDYGSSALLFRAKVSSVSKMNNLSLIRFASDRPYSVSCQFSNSALIKPGQTISVAAPGGSAIREKQGVLLRNCVEN